MSEPSKFDLVGFIIGFEEGSLSEAEVIAGIQEMINSGVAWKLQGHYGRVADRFIQQRLCTAP